MKAERRDPETNPLDAATPSAFDDLIQSLGPASLLVLIEARMSQALRERTTAEDILQEALLHAWRDRRQCEWRGRKPFRAWILTIIDHRIRNLAAHESTLKQGGGRTPIPLCTGSSSSDAGIEPMASTTPSRIALYREQAGAMRAALEALPDDLREVVRLRLFEQLTIDEIGIRLGLGASAVRHRFSKGAEIYERSLAAAIASRTSESRGKSAADPRSHPSPD